jgi:tetraacyldisaccharide 4'-kinase
VTIQEVWYGDSFAAKVMRAILWPLSCLYSIGWLAYLTLYRTGLKKAYRPSCRVICIGNFTAGGTGKTPTSVFVAHCLEEMAIPFVIGCSGYGAPHSVGATVAPKGMLDAREWGDEPAELRELLPDVPMIVGRARVTSAKLCEEQFPGSILLMDDGFQHMPLARDISIILDPPLAHGFTFPAGPYREPRATGRKRADLVIPSEQYTQAFSNLSFSAPFGSVISAPSKARVVTAIGRPNHFRMALERAGVEVIDFIELPDHDKMDIDLASRETDLPWVITRKDWVKLKSHCNVSEVEIIIADRTVTLEPVDEFKKWLKIRLG